MPDNSKLLDLLRDLSNEVTKFDNNVKQLNETNEHIVAFNESFGKLLGAINVHSDLLEQPLIAIVGNAKQAAAPVNQLLHLEESNTQETKSENEKPRQPAAKTKPKTMRKRKPKKKQETKFALKLKSLHSRLPKKYQTTTEKHRDNLETVLEFLYSRMESGAVLSEVVKSTGATVMQTNEYLNLLIKLSLITKKKQKLGVKFIMIKDAIL